MQLKKSKIAIPSGEDDLGFDCVWLVFSPKRKKEPFDGEFLRWLDWRSLGAVSQLFQTDALPKLPTLLPLPKGAPVRWVAVERSDQTDWPRFLRNCAGQQWQRTLIYFDEEDSGYSEAESALKKLGSSELPKEIVLAADR